MDRRTHHRLQKLLEPLQSRPGTARLQCTVTAKIVRFLQEQKICRLNAGSRSLGMALRMTLTIMEHRETRASQSPDARCQKGHIRPHHTKVLLPNLFRRLLLSNSSTSGEPQRPCLPLILAVRRHQSVDPVRYVPRRNSDITGLRTAHPSNSLKLHCKALARRKSAQGFKKPKCDLKNR